MAIVNRDKDPSEQRDVFTIKVGGVSGGASGIIAAGTTFALLPVPYPCELQSLRTYTQGASGSPVLSFFKSVYVSGAGQTVYAMGVSGIPLVNFASIGLQGASILPSAGSTTIQLSAGDVIIANNVTGAATEIVVQLVVKKLQDIVSANGQ